ncbi:hypothetical protein ABKV19_025593 [Rosa sericea]
MKTPRTQFENLRPTAAAAAAAATEAPKPHLGNVTQTTITTTTREAPKPPTSIEYPKPHSDYMEERIFVLDQDPNVNPAIVYLHENGTHRLHSTASPGDDVYLIGQSAGRACFHHNKKHEFMVWNITNQTVDAKIEEFPGLHKREDVAFGFSYASKADCFYIVLLRIPLLQNRKMDPSVSMKRQVQYYRSDENVWFDCTIVCDFPFHPCPEPAIAADGFMFWKASVFSRNIILKFDFENTKFVELDLPQPPKNEKLDFNTLRLGFGYRGEVVVSSYLAPTAVQPAGKLRVWQLVTRSWKWTKVQDLKLKVTSGTEHFLPLVFFKGTKEDYRYFLRDGVDIFKFKSKGEGTWDFRRVHSTLHCRAFGFGPSPCEEVCQTQTPHEEEVEKKVTPKKGRAKSSRQRDKVKKD